MQDLLDIVLFVIGRSTTDSCLQVSYSRHDVFREAWIVDLSDRGTLL